MTLTDELFEDDFLELSEFLRNKITIVNIRNGNTLKIRDKWWISHKIRMVHFTILKELGKTFKHIVHESCSQIHITVQADLFCECTECMSADPLSQFLENVILGCLCIHKMALTCSPCNMNDNPQCQSCRFSYLML